MSDGGAGGDDAPASKVPWVRILVVFLIAMVVLPIGAFYLTVFALGGDDCPTGRGVPVSELINNTC